MTYTEDEFARRPIGSASGDLSSTSGEPTPLPPKFSTVFGNVRGMPRFQFWCRSCDRQVKVKSRGWTSEEMAKPHGCPSCGNAVLVFYTEQNTNLYYRFILGLSIFAGGIFSTTIVNAFGFNLPLLMMGLVELIVGGIILWNLIQLKISGPPPYASETITPFPNSEFLKEIVILVIVAFFLGFIVFSLGAAITF